MYQGKIITLRVERSYKHSSIALSDSYVDVDYIILELNVKEAKI